MIRTVKIGLVVSVALWGFIGALGNILDWSQALGAVTAVTSMATFEGGSESWQATTSPIIIWAGALFIMLSKLTAGVMCAVGAGRMWQSRGSDAADFAAAKSIALAGCGIGAAAQDDWCFMVSVNRYRGNAPLYFPASGLMSC